MRNENDMIVAKVCNAIEQLWQVLERKLQMAASKDQSSPPAFQEQWDKRQQLLKKHVGNPVKITITGPHCGQIVTVTGPTASKWYQHIGAYCWQMGRPFMRPARGFATCKTKNIWAATNSKTTNRKRCPSAQK